MKSTTAIILVLYFIQGSLGHGILQSPIVGIEHGHRVEIEDAPYMVSIMEVDKQDDHNAFLLCGGSIIHRRFVLTAAQCLDYPPVVVRVGSSQLHEEGKLHTVERYIVHELYDRYKTPEYDVALLKLSEPVTLGPSVNIIKLADDTVNIPVGLNANVTGWGITEHGTPSEYLQQLSVTVSPRALCGYHGYNLTDKQICVSNNDAHQGFCSKDEGGPLVAVYTDIAVQIAIASWGPACAGFSNVYVSVTPHLNWIRNKIRQNL